MARIVLLLMVVSVLMFAFVLTTQPQLIRSAVVSYEDFVRNTPLGKGAEEEEKQEPKKEPAPVRPKTARKVQPVQPVQLQTEEIPVMPVVMESPRLSRVVSVAKDDVTLYSFNSADGPVVTVLKKGTIVEPQLELNDGGRRWSYVSVADRQFSGFLPSDNLERKRVQ